MPGTESHLCWQIFGVPPQARRAKPFIDHVLTFSILDSKIWFRNFQVGNCLFGIYTWKVAMVLTGDECIDHGERPIAAEWTATDDASRNWTAICADSDPYL
jgi:hypothetical protein